MKAKYIQNLLIALNVIVLSVFVALKSYPVRIDYESHYETNDISQVKKPSTEEIKKNEFESIYKGQALFKPLKRAMSNIIGGAGINEIVKNLTLRGILNLGGVKKAMIHSKKKRTTNSYKEGELVGSLKLLEIRSSSVTLEYGGQVVELTR